jgi:aquaporin Z
MSYRTSPDTWEQVQVYDSVNVNEYDNSLKPYIIEGVGTFALVFIGCGTAAMMTPDNKVAMLIVAIAFALILMVIIYLWGSISGAHVNPVVSMAMALDGRISGGKMFGYWLAQFIGAILAAILLLYIFGNKSTLGSSIGYLTDTFPWKAVLIETIITFFLVYIILIVTANDTNETIQKYAGIIIGATLGLGVLFGYLLTGGSMNPARSFGPALISNNMKNIWIYFVGPIAGSILAFVFYRGFHAKPAVVQPVISTPVNVVNPIIYTSIPSVNTLTGYNVVNNAYIP